MALPEKSWTFDNWNDEMSGSLTDIFFVIFKNN